MWEPRNDESPHAMVSLLWNDEVEGTLLVVAAACVFAVVAVIVKTDPLPVLLATELRFVVSWIISIAFMLLFQKKLNLRWLGPPGSQRWLILKGVLQVSFITCWWTALQRAPVGNCVAIIYSSPILTSVFSRLLLKEPLGSQFPLQVLLSVIGVMLILGLPFHGLLSVAFWRHSWSSSGEEYHFVFLALLFSALLPLVTKQTQECSWIEANQAPCFHEQARLPRKSTASLARSGASDLPAPDYKPSLEIQTHSQTFRRKRGAGSSKPMRQSTHMSYDSDFF
ncbi:unnamed protein product [Durusdinium trenchii]|uniref:EamA domain-containing protein n=1 Tax=Durusdinium trenchii TaxID=1381693 RepID=A0ABP0QXI9_9DINO